MKFNKSTTPEAKPGKKLTVRKSSIRLLTTSDKRQSNGRKPTDPPGC